MGYKTAFPNTENPISQGGIWQHNDPAQKPCQSIPGFVYGTQTGSGGFDDSQAYLKGSDWGDSYTVECTVWIKGGIAASPQSEVEILLRASDTSASGSMVNSCYEINVGHTGRFANIGRFKGAALVSAGNNTDGSVGFTPATGDKFKASVYTKPNGDVVITAYWNGVQFLQATDSDPALKIMSGGPGIGFYIDSVAASNDDFRFSDFQVSRIVMVGTPVHAGVQNAGSIAAAYTPVMAKSKLVAMLSLMQASTTAQGVITPTDSVGGQNWLDLGSQALSLDTPNGVRYGAMMAALENPAAGAHTVTYTFPNGVTYAELTIAEWIGLNPGGALDRVASGTSATSPLTVGPTSTLMLADELVVSVICVFAGTGTSNGGISAPPAGYSLLFAEQDLSATIGAVSSWKEVLDTAGVSASWSWTDPGVNDTAGMLATFVAATIGTPQPRLPDIPFPQVILDDMGLGGRSMLDVRAW
jgi:hypothetical protein